MTERLCRPRHPVTNAGCELATDRSDRIATDPIVSPADALPRSSQVARIEGADHAPPRIYYVHPLLIGPVDSWNEIFDHAAGLGFDTILMAPPFEPGHGGSIFLPRDMERLHPALGRERALDGIARLADMARARKLALALDVVADRVAADSAFARSLGLAPSGSDILDPRQDPADREAIVIPFDPSDPGGHPYLSMLSESLRALHAAGVSGFRCLHWDRVPPAALERLIASVREDASDVRFLAWTPGAPLEAQHGLRGAGFDGTFLLSSSLAMPGSGSKCSSAKGRQTARHPAPRGGARFAAA